MLSLLSRLELPRDVVDLQRERLKSLEYQGCEPDPTIAWLLLTADAGLLLAKSVPRARDYHPLSLPGFPLAGRSRPQPGLRVQLRLPGLLIRSPSSTQDRSFAVTHHLHFSLVTSIPSRHRIWQLFACGCPSIVTRHS